MAQQVASPGPGDTRDHPTAPADRRWLVLVVVAVAQLMVVLDATVVNIALPSAQHALGFSNAGFRTSSLTLGSSDFQAELAPLPATPSLAVGPIQRSPR